jgi:hypothetical protein
MAELDITISVTWRICCRTWAYRLSGQRIKPLASPSFFPSDRWAGSGGRQQLWRGSPRPRRRISGVSAPVSGRPAGRVRVKSNHHLCTSARPPPGHHSRTPVRAGPPPIHFGGEDGDTTVQQNLRACLLLDADTPAVLIEAPVWSRQTYRGERPSLLVLCDTPYDPDGYILQPDSKVAQHEG